LNYAAVADTLHHDMVVKIVLILTLSIQALSMVRISWMMASSHESNHLPEQGRRMHRPRQGCRSRTPRRRAIASIHREQCSRTKLEVWRY
jgi:hypothetical protein